MSLSTGRWTMPAYAPIRALLGVTSLALMFNTLFGGRPAVSMPWLVFVPHSVGSRAIAAFLVKALPCLGSTT